MNRSSAHPSRSRRLILKGLAAGSFCLATPRTLWADARSSAAHFNLSSLSSVALRDIGSSVDLDALRPGTALPPASVLKVMTTLYALDALGEDHRFATSLRALGPIEGDTLRGGLALVGGGDPVLDADALSGLAARLAGTGIRQVNGPFLVVDGALPFIAEIDPSQPRHVGYNPALSGINLNFNRVRVEWTPGKGKPDFRFVAPGRNFRVALLGIGGELGTAPPPSHRMQGAREIWTLPGARMTGKGGLWLPVRQPAIHAGEVFRELCAKQGLTLPEAEAVAAAPEGRDIAIHESPPLADILRDMLRYSTNLTAEVVGLHASKARGETPQTLAESGAAMTLWARKRYGLESATFHDHSGLSDRSLWSAAETVHVLAAEADGALPGLLRALPLSDAEGRPLNLPHVEASAKTGTLYFASGLAGYLQTTDRRLAFAIYSADLERRASIPQPAPEAPPGARSWAGRARGMQRELLREWATDNLPEPLLRPRHRPG